LVQTQEAKGGEIVKGDGNRKNHVGRGTAATSEEEARTVTGTPDGASGGQGTLTHGQRWTVRRKREVVMRNFDADLWTSCRVKRTWRSTGRTARKRDAG